MIVWAALVTVAFGGKIDKLSEQEQIDYGVFRAFMTEDDRKAWLKLETAEDRTNWLKERKLWEKFHTLDAEEQTLVIQGKVAITWSRDQVYMAWGAPFQKQRLTGRNASRSELLVYRFEVDKDGYATPLVGKKTDYKAVDNYQIELILDDDIVTELKRKDGFE